MIDLISRIKQSESNQNRAQQIHQHAVQNVGANPAQIFAKQPPGSLAEFSYLERFHSESFNDAITGHSFLNHLIQFTQAGLAFARTFE